MIFRKIIQFFLYVGLVLLLLSFSACNNNNDLRKIEFQFIQSFNYYIDCTVDFEKKILLQKVKPFNDKQDTLKIEDIDSFHIAQKDLSLFRRKVNNLNIDSSSLKKTDDTFHSALIAKQINISNDTIETKCANITYDKKYEKELGLIHAFITLAHSTIDTDKGMNINSEIESYFPNKLRITRTNTYPIEFKFYGHVDSEQKEKELISFLMQFKKTKPIIFDVRSGCSYKSIQHILREYKINDNDFIYIYSGRDNIKEEYYQRVFKTKEEVLDAMVKEKILHPSKR